MAVVMSTTTTVVMVLMRVVVHVTTTVVRAMPVPHGILSLDSALATGPTLAVKALAGVDPRHLADTLLFIGMRDDGRITRDQLWLGGIDAGAVAALMGLALRAVFLDRTGRALGVLAEMLGVGLMAGGMAAILVMASMHHVAQVAMSH
jgi:hypothetical protein